MSSSCVVEEVTNSDELLRTRKRPLIGIFLGLGFREQPCQGRAGCRDASVRNNRLALRQRVMALRKRERRPPAARIVMTAALVIRSPSASAGINDRYQAMCAVGHAPGARHGKTFAPSSRLRGDIATSLLGLIARSGPSRLAGRCRTAGRPLGPRRLPCGTTALGSRAS